MKKLIAPWGQADCADFRGLLKWVIEREVRGQTEKDFTAEIAVNAERKVKKINHPLGAGRFLRFGRRLTQIFFSHRGHREHRDLVKRRWALRKKLKGLTTPWGQANFHPQGAGEFSRRLFWLGMLFFFDGFGGGEGGIEMGEERPGRDICEKI